MLFQSLIKSSIQLSNHAVMSPMACSRADDANTPSALMAEYYALETTV